jgi:HD-GYP domain-containing protein (c-di-GMP phosphodiesterase class II)
MFRISDIIGGFDGELDTNQNPRIYNDSLAKVKSLIQDVLQNKVSPQELDKSLAHIIHHFNTHEEVFLNSFFHIKDSSEFLYMHILNIMFLSCSIYRWLGFSEEEIVRLSRAAFFIDISLARADNILKKSGIKDTEEQNIINRHPIDSARVFESMFPADKETAAFIKNHHAHNLQGSFLRYDLIVLSENFESFIHPKPFRAAIKPHEAAHKTLLEFKHFDKETVRAFIGYIGLYPITTTVRLNTNEKAVVVAQNYGFPLRPKVRVLGGQSPNVDRFINLLNDKDAYIAQEL